MAYTCSCKSSTTQTGMFLHSLWCMSLNPADHERPSFQMAPTLIFKDPTVRNSKNIYAFINKLNTEHKWFICSRFHIQNEAITLIFHMFTTNTDYVETKSTWIPQKISLNSDKEPCSNGETCAAHVLQCESVNLPDPSLGLHVFECLHVETLRPNTKKAQKCSEDVWVHGNLRARLLLHKCRGWNSNQ